nr:MAG TPA_asm: hypothetical protein [Caudoviricetes sp.]
MKEKTGILYIAVNHEDSEWFLHTLKSRLFGSTNAILNRNVMTLETNNYIVETITLFNHTWDSRSYPAEAFLLSSKPFETQIPRIKILSNEFSRIETKLAINAKEIDMEQLVHALNHDIVPYTENRSIWEKNLKCK